MTSFEEFLKKESHKLTFTHDGAMLDEENWEQHKKLKEEEFVSVRALGEWAYAESVLAHKNVLVAEFNNRITLSVYKNDLLEIAKSHFMYDFPFELTYIHIAVDCLGEAEVRKRLEATK